MNKTLCLFWSLVMVFLLSSCGLIENSIAAQVAEGVSSTVVAIPTATSYPTLTPNPTYTPAPTFTPFPTLTPNPTYTPFPTPEPYIPDLTDLFCGYGFCVGHPRHAYLTDVEAPDKWSSEDRGYIWGVDDDGSIMIQVDWKEMNQSSWMPEDEIDTTLQDTTSRSEYDTGTFGKVEATYVDYAMDPSNFRPYGISAAWYCGVRAFRMIISAKREGIAYNLMQQALTQFNCGE